MTDLLWPAYDGPDDLAAIEAVPLADRSLPATTYHLVTRAAGTWGDRPAISCLTDAAHWQAPSVRSFTRLAEAVHRTANTFTALGVGRRDAVAIISVNCESMLWAILGAQAAGIAAPINPALSAGHVTKLAQLARTKVLVVSGPELDTGTWQLGRRIAADTDATALLALRPTAASGPGPDLEPIDGVTVGYLDHLAATAPPGHLQSPPPAASDIASYLHTGGTTGTPKLAAHTHGNQVADAWMIALGAQLGHDSTLFAALPLFHANAMMVTLLAPLLRGQHVVWAGPLGYRDRPLFGVFWKLVERYRIAAMSAVPTVYAALSQVPVNADISSLRLPIVGAAPLPAAVRDAFPRHTGVRLIEGYGLTEATCATTRNFPGTSRPGSVGQRLPYQRVKAVRVEEHTGARTDLPPGQIGILAISGPTVFPGYITGGPDGPHPDPAGKVADGWLDTGDLAHVDADGFVYLVGRRKDLIIRGGHNIDPAMIEDALLTHPAVTAASAVGRPDEHAGEVPVGYVTIAPGSQVTPDELTAWAAARVPERAAAPKLVTILDSLPLTAVGKPYKPELRRHATEHAITERLARIGVGGIHAELADGLVTVVVPLTEHKNAATAALDAYAITWRFE
jgi:fatty-acyl-CoA synthase